MKKLVSVLFSAAILALVAVSAQAVPVDLELLLLADVSGSVDATDFALQKGGYAAAFSDPTLQAAMLDGEIGSIAVSLVYWSSTQAVAVPWTLIDTASAANSFANSIREAPRTSSGGTAMTSALTYGASLFDDNGFESDFLTIDVSGDGSESTACNYYTLNCNALQVARDGFLTGGVETRTINALWIDDHDFFGDDVSDTINALEYGLTNVIGGDDAFQLIVQDFDGFSDGIGEKLQRELDPPPAVPEPSTWILMVTGLAGLAFYRRRKSA